MSSGSDRRCSPNSRRAELRIFVADSFVENTKGQPLQAELVLFDESHAIVTNAGFRTVFAGLDQLIAERCPDTSILWMSATPVEAPTF
jgi:hypothetical protein